jgi:uncharacterized repeat protein (TIGR03803 family)
VFTINTDGTGYSVLHNFTGGSTDGSYPLDLTADAFGTLYGTTFYGGANSNTGTAFKINPDGSNYAVLYNFCSPASCADGANPNGGNLFGVTLDGGNSKARGVAFSLTPSGSETVLHSFCSVVDPPTGTCLDRSGPIGGILVPDSSGNLYGTTQNGGAVSTACQAVEGNAGCGTVYKLAPGTETVLYSFTGGRRRASTSCRPDCRRQWQSLRYDILWWRGE